MSDAQTSRGDDGELRIEQRWFFDGLALVVSRYSAKIGCYTVKLEWSDEALDASGYTPFRIDGFATRTPEEAHARFEQLCRDTEAGAQTLRWRRELAR